MTTKVLQSIVIFNDNARITGGADKIALSSASGLAQRGYSVHLFTAVGPVDPNLQEVPGLRVTCTNQFEILHDPSRMRAAIQGLWNTKSGRGAEVLLDSLDPKTTVVHIHLWAKALSSSVVRAAVVRGFRVVCTLHDYMLACPVGTLFDHPRQSICTRSPLSISCITANCDSRTYVDKLWRVTRGAIQSSVGQLPVGLTDIIAISDLVSSVMKPYLPAAANLHRLSNFVDVEQQEPVHVECMCKFVFVGRLVPEKGPMLFAEAARTEGLQAMFLGDGVCRDEIQRTLPDAELSGWLSSDETLNHLRQARALVFPSRWYEAQPLVVIEALAQGIPCVIADTSAAREMIVDGVTGLLFKGGDIPDLRRKLKLLLNAEFAAAIGRNAYNAYWAEPKTLDRHLDGLEQIYEQMLQHQPQEVVA